MSVAVALCIYAAAMLYSVCATACSASTQPGEIHIHPHRAHHNGFLSMIGLSLVLLFRNVIAGEKIICRPPDLKKKKKIFNRKQIDSSTTIMSLRRPLGDCLAAY